MTQLPHFDKFQTGENLMISIKNISVSSLIFFVVAGCAVRPIPIIGSSIDDPIEGSYVLIENKTKNTFYIITLKCKFFLSDRKEFNKTVRIEKLEPNKIIKIRSGMGKDIKAECKQAKSIFGSEPSVYINTSPKWYGKAE